MVVGRAGYRMKRINVWLNPLADRWGDGYQTVNSLITVGSGGLFGTGLGQSWGKMGHLPYQYNDYIFAVISEELGLIGGITIMLLYLAFLWRGFYVTSHAPDMYGMLLGSAICFSITFQAFINISVVLNLLPATGLPLPFISYSGSSLVITMASVGILLNISKYCKL
jgi:cell division protein FtsW